MTFLLEGTNWINPKFKEHMPFALDVEVLELRTDNFKVSCNCTIVYKITKESAEEWARVFGFTFKKDIPRYVCDCYGSFVPDEDDPKIIPVIKNKHA